MAWTNKKGINFRSTAAFVTDPINTGPLIGEPGSLGDLPAYTGITSNSPVTIAGDTFNIGWVVTSTGANVGSSAQLARDRNAAVDPRCAGLQANQNAPLASIKIQVGTSAGTYKIWMAMTDQGNNGVPAVNMTIRDSFGTIATLSHAAITGNQVLDAAGNVYASAAAWAATADTSGLPITVSTTDNGNGNGGPIFYFDMPLGVAVAHIAIQQTSQATSSVLVGNNLPISGGSGGALSTGSAYSPVSSANLGVQNGVVGSLNMYVAATGSASHLYMALYDDIGPNLLCGGVTAINTGLNQIPIVGGPAITVGTQYHCVFQADGAGFIPVDNGVAFQTTFTSNFTLPLPAVLAHNNGATNGNGRPSIWADISGGGGNFAIAANTGAYTLQGQAATLATSSGSFSMPAAFGSVGLFGQAVTMVQGGFFTLIAFPGAYDYTGGQSTSDYQLDAATGIFATAGQIVNFTFNGNNSFGFTANVGVIALSGPAVAFALSQAFVLVQNVGTFQYLGGDASFSIAGGGVTPPPAPGTVLNLEVVTDAFQKIGVIDETQAPSAEQGSNGLRILNDYLLSQARDGMRLGWFKQTDLAAAAPLQSEDLWGVKTLLAKQLAIHYGIPIQDPGLLESFMLAEHWLSKRTLRYVESDFGELSRAQGGPWGTGGWF